MIKFIKKNKLKFISYFLFAFAMALFTFISFSFKTYAFTINDNGDLVGENLFDISNPSSSTNVTYTLDDNYKNIIIANSQQYGRVSYSYLYDSNTKYTLSLQYNQTITTGLIAIRVNETDINIPLNNNNGTIEQTFETLSSGSISILFYTNTSQYNNNELTISYVMLNKGEDVKSWEPYGIWYSEKNYDTIDNLYNNTLNQYNDLALGNNYGYWKYIDYVEFYVNNNNIFVPNTQEQNEWEISDLYNNNILKVGGYFDTTPLTMEPYQSDYNQVISYINFNAYTPSDSLIISFNNCNGCNVVINDDKSNSFTTIISETNYFIDISKIRESVPSFSLYVIDMRITPNNAEQNGIYFANNDYITAYNKGYNVATSNADRKYIPQITDLQNQINSLNNNINELSSNINTLKALNNDLQNQITNSTSWQNLFFAFADTPFKVVSNVLGFELFGLNLFATFIGMITVFGVVYLLKKFL